MFLRILKKDLKRKKTMNIILVLFIILATMFVSSGLNNVITVANGTDYYLDLAGVGDYIVITMGEGAVGALDDMLASEEAIDDYKIENVVFASQDDLSRDSGEDIVIKNTLIVQSCEGTGINFFGMDNEALPTLSQGHCYVTGNFLTTNDMEPGDTIYFEINGMRFEFVIDGKAKDAFLGSDLMGNTRLLISQEDMDRLTSDEEINRYNSGQVCYIETEDVKSVDAAIAKCSNVAFHKPRSTIKMGFVMDLIVAFVTLILSVCLMIVSFVVLKITINFTIAEEFREIGVMKAIGIGNFKIRSLYMSKYLLLSVVGSILGLIFSFPFGKVLIKSVSENMVLGNSLGVVPNIAGALAVVIAIMWFAYASTNKVKKATPIDAIRNGQTGERFNKKSFLKLKKSKSNAPTFMALNDVLSSPKRYMATIIAFALCTLFVLILVNTVNTMRSDRLIGTFSAKSDLYIDKTQLVMGNMTKSNEELEEYFEQVQSDLSEMGYPCEVYEDFQYTYPVISNGNEYSVVCSQGHNTTMDMYDIIEGTVPQNEYEIAITHQISEKIDAQIGDTITIDYGSEKIDCVVVAYFETMNQLGELIRIHEDAPTDSSYVSSSLQVQIGFTDNPSEEEIINRQERLKEYFDTDNVQTATEYQVSCIAVVPTMEAVQYLLLGITLIVVLLVTILMERSFIADEKSEIAILKAVGFRDSRVILWHVLRFGIVALVASIIAALLSIPMTNLCITPIFGMMGATNFSYVINPLEVFLVYPLIIVVMTVVVTFFTALYTKTIKACDTASIE